MGEYMVNLTFHSPFLDQPFQTIIPYEVRLTFLKDDLFVKNLIHPSNRANEGSKTKL